jgi:ATP-dependent DNA helicase RecQ
MLYLDSERLPTTDLFIAPETYRHRYDMTVARFNGMLKYSTAEDKCRSVIIQNYFGDMEATPCGVCDVCLRAKRLDRGDDECEIRVKELLACREMDIKTLVTELGEEGERVVEIVDKLVREGKILLSERGKLKYIK